MKADFFHRHGGLEALERGKLGAPKPRPGQTLVRVRASLATLRRGPHSRLEIIGELSLLLLWALYVGRRFLDLDPSLVPVGSEFGVVTQAHYVWRLLPECGSCVFWNGTVNGGFPAFVDLQGATLNPVVILTTLLLGVINGSKIVLVTSLFLAGLAQWWLARLLGVGRLARLWSGAMATAGAHIAGRLELGLVTMVLAIAIGSLVFAAWFRFLQSPDRRAATGFAVLLGLLLLSGQGYIQYATVFAVFPSGAVLLLPKRSGWKPIARHLVVAAAIGLLVAAPLLVPTIHFWPSMRIHSDPYFSGGQPLEYLPLNLVIRDIPFFFTPTLQRVASPAVSLLYIGWIPVLLAVVGATVGAPKSRRNFLLVSALMIFLLTSAEGPRALSRIIPDLAAMLRYPSLGTAIAVTPLLGLSALGIERIVRSEKIRVAVASGSWKTAAIRLWQVLLFVVLLQALRSAYGVSRQYLQTQRVPDVSTESLPFLSRSPGQWIAPPDLDYLWYPAVQSRGLMLASAFRPWGWINHGPVEPYYEGSYLADTMAHPDYLLSIAGVHWMLHRENQFAFIRAGPRQVPCNARARGGSIDVECPPDASGILVVQENAWSGWTVSRDGQPAELITGQWLATRAPAGALRYEFRYRPWDAPLGLTLAGLGIVIAAWNVRRKDKVVAPNLAKSPPSAEG